MFDLANIWTQFAVCLALIAWGGVKLSRYGDVIAEKTGMGVPGSVWY